MSTEHDIGYGWTLKQENEEELEVVYITAITDTFSFNL